MQTENFGSEVWLQNGKMFGTPICPIKISALIFKMANHVYDVNALIIMLCTQVVFRVVIMLVAYDIYVIVVY